VTPWSYTGRARQLLTIVQDDERTRAADELLAEVRDRKDQAIEDQQYEKAASYRDAERKVTHILREGAA
jgi:hypothetical protein